MEDRSRTSVWKMNDDGCAGVLYRVQLAHILRLHIEVGDTKSGEFIWNGGVPSEGAECSRGEFVINEITRTATDPT